MNRQQKENIKKEIAELTNKLKQTEDLSQQALIFARLLSLKVKLNTAQQKGLKQ